MILFFSSDLFKQYVLSYHKDDLTTILLEEDETEHYAVNIEWVVFLLILNEECYSIKVRFFLICSNECSSSMNSELIVSVV